MTVQEPVPPATDAGNAFPVALTEDPTDLRLALHCNDYRPVPVLGAHVAMKAAGKRPMMKGWEREIIERAAAQQTQLFGKAEYVNPEFREALLRVAGEGGAINGTRLGKWLSQHQNRIVAGHRIIAAGTTGNRARWQLDIVNADTPDGSDPFRRAANA